jgi:hypothetical protein
MIRRRWGRPGRDRVVAGGRDVAVAVHNAPLPILTSVNMGDPQAVGPRLTLNLHAIVLIADGVGQVTTGACRDNLEVEVG